MFTDNLPTPALVLLIIASGALIVFLYFICKKLMRTEQTGLKLLAYIGGAGSVMTISFFAIYLVMTIMARYSH
ncbi:MAG: hypothetical protein ILP08_01490 [Lachnospiraceae bacterium]|nr:hypothetical protein [Lachnospiraceae bacterium]